MNNFIACYATIIPVYPVWTDMLTMILLYPFEKKKKRKKALHFFFIMETLHEALAHFSVSSPSET